jgi:hypothetical protein
VSRTIFPGEAYHIPHHFGQLIGPGAVAGLDFEAIETAARRQALHVAARAVEQRLNADLRDHLGPTVPCSCGQAARYAGRRTKYTET